ncbi:MAG TPA: hypothetical protein VGG27_10500 [Magnetospirillaceae bacterium]
MIRAEEARATAATQLAKARQEEEAIWQERQKLRAVDAEKFAQLRQLRLQKEEADRNRPAEPKKLVKRKAPAKH